MHETAHGGIPRQLPCDYAPRLSGMSQWSEDLIARFAASMRARRQQLGLSAQEVADRTEAMGHPIGRSAIAAWENASRGDRMMLGDALVLAEALRIPLGNLLYPEQPDGEVEALPGVTTTSLNAAQSLIGVGGSHIETAPEGVDEDQRRREYMSSRDLYSMGVQIQSMRDEISKIRMMMERPDVRGDFDLVASGLKKIEQIEAGIEEKAEMIRLMGGAVRHG